MITREQRKLKYTQPGSGIHVISGTRTLGGQGSGYFGHAGRPTQVGGSAPAGTVPWKSERSDRLGPYQQAMAQDAKVAMQQVARDFPTVKPVINTLHFGILDAGTAGLWEPDTNTLNISIVKEATTVGDMVPPLGPTLFNSTGNGYNVACTARHEYGHAVYFTAFSQQARDEWEQLVMNPDLKGAPPWEQETMSPFSPQGERLARAISMYAGANHLEMFAEAFARYVHPKYAGDLPAPVEAFLKKWVGVRRAA